MPAQYFCPQCDVELDPDIREPVDYTLEGQGIYQCDECGYEGILDNFEGGDGDEDENSD